MRVFLTTLVLCLASVSTAFADWVDDFTGGVPQQTWIFGAVPNGFQYTTNFNSGSGGYLEIGSNLPVGAGGAAAVFGVVNDVFAGPGVRVDSRLNPTGANLETNVGVLANLVADVPNGVATGYVATITYGQGGSANPASGALTITKINSPTQQEMLIDGVIPNFDPNSTYNISLQWHQGDLLGRVFDDQNNQLLSLSTFDSDYAFGLAGVLLQRPWPGTSPDSMYGTWGSVSATAVPEPSTLVVLGAVSLLALGVRRRS